MSSYDVTVTVLVGATTVDVLVVEVIVVEGICMYDAQNAVAALCCFAEVTILLTLEQNADVVAPFGWLGCASEAPSKNPRRSNVCVARCIFSDRRAGIIEWKVAGASCPQQDRLWLYNLLRCNCTIQSSIRVFHCQKPRLCCLRINCRSPSASHLLTAECNRCEGCMDRACGLRWPDLAHAEPSHPAHPA